MESRGLPPETSNFYCLPGRAGGTPNVLGYDAKAIAQRLNVALATVKIHLLAIARGMLTQTKTVKHHFAPCPRMDGCFRLAEPQNKK
jgi:hypothetical protein